MSCVCFNFFTIVSSYKELSYLHVPTACLSVLFYHCTISKMSCAKNYACHEAQSLSEYRARHATEYKYVYQPQRLIDESMIHWQLEKEWG